MLFSFDMLLQTGTTCPLAAGWLALLDISNIAATPRFPYDERKADNAKHAKGPGHKWVFKERHASFTLVLEGKN